MPTLSIQYSDDLLIASGQSPEGLEAELRVLLAVKLFEMGRLSLGKAAEFAGVGKIAFMDDLARNGVPVINLDDDQLQDELRAA
jgi:predicted HTH domain antitoxin